jgi:hypothetical protein
MSNRGRGFHSFQSLVIDLFPLKLLIIILTILFFSCLYGSLKAVTDSVRDYPANNRLIKHLEGLGWTDFARENVKSDISFFRGVWHTSEWFKEFVLFGLAFVCLCYKPERGDLIIIGISMIVSFWVSGQLFYYLYHSYLIN